MDNDKMWGGVFLALFLFGWCVWMLSKIVTRLFHDLGVMFDAIGTAAVSFLGMAWVLVQLAGVLAAGAAIVYAAYRYYQLVKKSVEVLASVEVRCSEFAAAIEEKEKELEARLTEEVAQLRHALAIALAKPEVGPEPVKPPEPTAAPPQAATDATQTAEPTPGVSNPY